MKFTTAAFTCLAFLSTFTSALPAAVAPRATDPISQKTRPYYELCADLQKQLGIPTINIKPLLSGSKREFANITFEDRDLAKRETLSPVLATGRSYTVVLDNQGKSSRGHRAATAAYTPIGKGESHLVGTTFVTTDSYCLCRDRSMPRDRLRRLVGIPDPITKSPTDGVSCYRNAQLQLCLSCHREPFPSSLCLLRVQLQLRRGN